MRTIGVVTDCHSSITPEEAARIGVRVITTPFYIEGKCHYEYVTLSREEFLEKLCSGIDITTSQPSPEEITGVWDEELEKYGQIIYIPLSSALSGSCMITEAFSHGEKYEGRVFVVDNGSVATPMHRSVLDALELIDEGYSAAQIKEILEGARDKMIIYIGVDNMDRLKRGGRISPATAAFATALNIKPVIRFGVGELDIFRKCHGFRNARKVMIEALHQDMETRFRPWYDRGEITLMAASSASPEVTADWVREIGESFPGMNVMYDPISMAVTAHVGYGGLGIGCSCRPERPEKR